ncbi:MULTISPECIES: SDR family oxidoreductase [Enterobacteriaceae]|uniref:SDR family oxidoreductase n=2 Tax=Enterobacterales TaxID=91347 RepID=UPI000E2F1FDA|nr:MULTISPECIES: SDR family oxidoreductase [Klebsiella]ELP2755539.1 SDR family oxidoreductase [Klebsiella oxytoca]QZY82760.1 SDR family oxidoreductase [Klebsiella sp. CTHL.F3a]HDX8919365.1 SDR family oxidoreductase [Klebsiella michiganensis]EKU4312429.1 SDR family oxidoreductase [Klebsiella pneumoniae]EKV0201804.1 SDR family oxidoreductase [Klebsiella pneumoniae]
MEEAGRIFIRNERSTSLLGRMASAEEVANLIVYLSSDRASATTGTAVRVDGGSFARCYLNLRVILSEKSLQQTK